MGAFALLGCVGVGTSADRGELGALGCVGVGVSLAGILGAAAGLAPAVGVVGAARAAART
ncbi:MAG: hypothetical protein R3B70_03335 [Polyangiaceae bacterium]